MKNVSDNELPHEVNAKQARVIAWLEQRRLDGILLRRRENVAWMTAGQSSRTVVAASETGVASLLVLKDGRRYSFAANNEAPRLAEEEFNTLGFEPIVYPWYEDLPIDTVRKLSGNGNLASDIFHTGLLLSDIAPLRWKLLAGEVSRYRGLARQTAEVVSTALLQIAQQTNTWELEARVSYELHRLGIEPTVLLIAADDRIRKYKHAVTRGERIQRFGMINLCARRDGLVVSITRYVHFGPLPRDLERHFAASAQVYAHLLSATYQGNTSQACFRVASECYAGQGFPGGENEHHQGGAAGYLEREWLACPGGTEVIAAPQAFAWNPSIQGAKVEDTILLTEEGLEVMTATPALPTVTNYVGEQSYQSARVLVR